MSGLAQIMKNMGFKFKAVTKIKIRIQLVVLNLELEYLLVIQLKILKKQLY